MTHNFSISYRTNSKDEIQVFEVQALSFFDALNELHDLDEDAVYLSHDVDLNPALFEPETDTINSAIESRKNR